MARKRDNRHPTRGFQYLHGNYVYYRRLSTDGYYPALAEQVNVRQLAIIDEATNLEAISQYFFNMADIELTKEMDLLHKKFGSTISGDYSN